MNFTEVSTASRALGLLQQVGSGWVALRDMREAGLDHPASALYELELAGYTLTHRNGKVRLDSLPRPAPRGTA